MYYLSHYNFVFLYINFVALQNLTVTLQIAKQIRFKARLFHIALQIMPIPCYLLPD